MASNRLATNLTKLVPLYFQGAAEYYQPFPVIIRFVVPYGGRQALARYLLQWISV